MASVIGWIDFSPKHRDRIRKFMDMMGVGGVVDELGVGMIRDNMSNKLFPGFSTLYTRAKYFFITPYILLDQSNKQKRNQTGQEYFSKAETAVNRVIIEFYNNHIERADESYFGKSKQNGHLKRQPSAIYWNGMHALSLITENSSLEQILSGKRSFMEDLLSSNTGDETTKEQGEYRGHKCVNVAYDTQWLTEIQDHGLSLNRTEAETLRDRLLTRLPNSLPTALVTDENLWNLYTEAKSTYKNSRYSVNNPFVEFVDSACDMITNEELKNNLIAAHDLSLFLHGMHIAYNIQFWSKQGSESAQLFVQEKRSDGEKWLQELKPHMINNNFNICDYMPSSVRAQTRKYLNDMQTMVSKANKWDAIEAVLCQRAEQQERWNKKNKSRFVKLEKGQVIDEINSDSPIWLGLDLIKYRYNATYSIVTDIYEGLKIV